MSSDFRQTRMSEKVRTSRGGGGRPRAAKARQAQPVRPRQGRPPRGKVGKPTALRRPTPEQLYKTQLCVHFQRGACRYGAQCTFAHGASELKDFSYNRSGRVHEDADKPASDAAGCETSTEGWNPPVMLGAAITVPEEDWQWTEYIWRRFASQSQLAQSSVPVRTRSPVQDAVPPATAQAAPPATAQGVPPATAQAVPPYAYPCPGTRAGRFW